MKRPGVIVYQRTSRYDWHLCELCGAESLKEDVVSVGRTAAIVDMCKECVRRLLEGFEQ